MEVEMVLYCWPCESVHAFPLADVERLVYALGAMERDAIDPGRRAAAQVACLNAVFNLSCWGRDEDYLVHVERSINARLTAPIMSSDGR